MCLQNEKEKRKKNLVLNGLRSMAFLVIVKINVKRGRRGVEEEEEIAIGISRRRKTRDWNEIAMHTMNIEPSRGNLFLWMGMDQG